jgi:hypothetical protein
MMGMASGRIGGMSFFKAATRASRPHIGLESVSGTQVMKPGSGYAELPIARGRSPEDGRPYTD